MSENKSGIIRPRNDYFRTIDYWIIVPIVLISTIGIFVLQRVLSDGFDDYPYNLYRQIGAAVLGLSVALFICVIDTHFLKLFGWITYGLSLLMLFIVLVDNFSLQDQWGADRALLIPFVGTFQPSELTKIGLVIVTAYILHAVDQKQMPIWKGFLLLIPIYLVPFELIRRQPDFGTTLVMVFALVCIIFVWGIKYRYIFLGVSAMVIVIIPLVWNFILVPYQKARILSFAFSGSDPSADYNLVQAQTAIASGGLSGNHTGELVHVPVKESDFIYAAVSEHMGFIGTTTLILLAFFFIGRCLYVASKTDNSAYAYTIVGLSGIFAFQYIENMGMNVGIMPITGLPLPFVSLGGSAMMVNYIAFGIILNLSMERSIARR